MAKNSKIAKYVDVIFESYSYNFNKLFRKISSYFNSAEFEISCDAILADMYVDLEPNEKLCYWYQKVVDNSSCTVKIFFKNYT